MATGPQSNGLYDTAGLDLSGLFQQVLGSQTDTGVKENQTTTGNTNTTNNGTVDTTGLSSNTSKTSGITANISDTESKNRTQGVSNSSTQSSTSGGRSWSENQQTSADIAGLQEVLKRQLAGITPEMLAAIFSEGSKAAPQLLTAQSNALGVRAGHNTPVAAALNMLNGQMLSKAADVNLNMLRDASGTANSIGNFTKQVTTSGSESSFSNTNSTTNTMMDQLVTGSTHGTNIGFNNSTTVNDGVTSNKSVSANNSNVVANQNVVANKDTKVQTTVNKDIASGLAAMVAAGVGIDQLFKIATGKGFVGTMQDFIASLKGSGVTIPGDLGASTIDNAFGGQGVDLDTGEFGFGVTGDGGNVFDIGSGDGLSDLSYGDYDGFDYGFDFGFADGGLLDVTKLIKDDEKTGAPNIRQLLALLNANTQNKPTSSTQPSTSTNAAKPAPGVDTSGVWLDDTPPAAKINPADAKSPTKTVETYGDAGGTQVLPNQSADLVPYYTGGGQGGDGGGDEGREIGGYLKPAGRYGDIILQHVYDKEGNFVKTEKMEPDGMQRGMETLLPLLASIFIPGAGAVMNAGKAVEAADNGDTAGAIKSGIAAYNGFADGGEITGNDSDDPMAQMMSAMGIAKTPDGLHLNTQAMKLLQKALGGESKEEEEAEGHANGGQITGPGTGTSDSIPADGPGGSNIKVSNGEFIIPADVVQQLGPHFFDHLISKYHTPVK